MLPFSDYLTSGLRLFSLDVAAVGLANMACGHYHLDELEHAYTQDVIVNA